MNIQFGSGVVFGKPIAGNQPVNPTPYRLGVLQECTVDFKGDLKKLFGQNQFAVATARGKIDCTIKGKLAVFDIAMLNQLYFAQTLTPGYQLIVDGESHLVSAGTFSATNVPITEDWGAIYAATGQALTNQINVAAIVQGQYNLNATSGLYTVSTADNGLTILASYRYAVNTGSTMVIANQLMGYAPEIDMLLYNYFRNKFFSIELFDVTLGSISVPTKLEDFWISDFDGSANANISGNVGQFMLDNF